MTQQNITDQMKLLSPRRNSTQASNIADMVSEQIVHFGIDPASPSGQHLSRVAEHLYRCQYDLDLLWTQTLREMDHLPLADRTALFNAKKFLAYQLAKLLDNLQQPLRRSYQQLEYRSSSKLAKGPYPLFDNVTALFAAHPVIARTATYIYACAEWIADAFQGRELMLEIYSRLLNPTSVALANHIVDLEAGEYADEYFAWNFNSGMAAIDAILSHLLGRDDVLITNRNIYGGAFQLIHDWFGKSSNLEIGVETFSGFDADSFKRAWDRTQKKYADRIAAGRRVYVYIESPCNPHGDILDVAGICAAAHQLGSRVVLDATVATPFLFRALERENPAERPDFIVHSYTKDISGLGTVIAGCLIGRNEDMFLPKGLTAGNISRDQTVFWNVYYVKGAFLNADAAFEVLQGVRTLDVRMLAKCISTRIFTEVLNRHPQINVHCPGLADSPNHDLCEKYMFLGLPAPLFTLEIEGVPADVFARFFDGLSPTFGHMISLGQSNTIITCPALTTHSELSASELAKAGITPTTIRVAMGDEHPQDLIQHFIATATLFFDHVAPGFSEKFPSESEINQLVTDIYVDTHRRYITSRAR